MAAVQTPLRPPAQPAGGRPRLVVIEGGRSARRRHLRRVYLRRRLGVIAALVLTAWWVGAALTEPPPAPPSNPITGASYVVEPGDTLWEVAGRLDRGGDIRMVVDRLAEVNGSDSLVAGQQLVIPADLRS